MNAFDHRLLLYLNHVADQSPVFTKVVRRRFFITFLIAEVFWPALRLVRGIAKLAAIAR